MIIWIFIIIYRIMFDMKYCYLEFNYSRIVFAIMYVLSKSGGVMSRAYTWPRVHSLYFNSILCFCFQTEISYALAI